MLLYSQKRSQWCNLWTNLSSYQAWEAQEQHLVVSDFTWGEVRHTPRITGEIQIALFLSVTGAVLWVGMQVFFHNIHIISGILQNLDAFFFFFFLTGVNNFFFCNLESTQASEMQLRVLINNKSWCECLCLNNLKWQSVSFFLLECCLDTQFSKT